MVKTMTTPTLTKRQQEIYDAIRQLMRQRGFGPTVREIGRMFGISSPNGVVCHLKALERKGLIIRHPRQSRAIELVGELDRQPHAMPMAGVVAAGPITMAVEQQEKIDLGEVLYRDDRFVLRVSGDSMIDAHIADGDYVVIQPANTAESGQMVVALTADGEATLKYWYPEQDRIRLQPANREMAPIWVDDASVIGVAVGVVRPQI